MADLGSFDATQYRQSDGHSKYAPIPSGQYEAVITESSRVRNRAGTGSYLQLVFQITNGPHAGRKLWERLNLEHPNESAVAAAKNRLAAICQAVGVLRPRDSIELHNLPLVIQVGQRQRPDNGEIVNEIRDYKRARIASQQPKSTWPSDF